MLGLGFGSRALVKQKVECSMLSLTLMIAKIYNLFDYLLVEAPFVT